MVIFLSVCADPLPPWLTSLNEKFKKVGLGSTIETKYILYGSTHEADNDAPNNLINDHWGLEQIPTANIYKKGYFNDSGVPVTSAFLDFSKHDNYIDKDKDRNSKLFDSTYGKVLLYDSFIHDPNQCIHYENNDSYKDWSKYSSNSPIVGIRFFKDYTHEQMCTDIDIDEDNVKDNFANGMDTLKKYREQSPHYKDETKRIEVAYPLFDTIRYDLENIYINSLEREGHAQILGDITIEPYPVVLNHDFTISFTLKELRGSPKCFDELKIEILDIEDNIVFDFAKFTFDPEHPENMTIPALGTMTQSAINRLYEEQPKGRYKIRIKGRTSNMVDGDWFIFDAVDDGVNPKDFMVIAPGETLEGYASISKGITITPVPVSLNRDFQINFELKEINGIEKIFEEIAIVILDSENNRVFDFAIFTNESISAMGTLSKTARNKIFETHPTGNYKAVIRGRNPGGDWFDFDTIAKGENFKEFPVIKSWTETSKIDLVFIIDTTGSMGDDINQAKASALEIVNEIEAQTPDYRIALVTFEDFPYSPYGDESCGDYMYHDILKFTNDKDTIVSAIQSIELRCGGDGPESHYSAMMHCFQKESLGVWRDNVSKAAILMTDAPPHEPEPETGYVYQDVIDASIALDPVIIYPVIIGGYYDTEVYMKLLADGTDGRVFKARNSEEVVKSISKAVRMATGSTATKQTADENTTVTLYGSASVYYDDSIVSYKWAQIEKSPDWISNIQLSDSESADPTFKAPEVGEDNGIVKFSLILTSETGEQYEDTYLVEIINHGPGDENRNSSSTSCFINTVVNHID